MTGVEDVLDFWLGELREQDWYAGGAALDGAIRARFAKAWDGARAGAVQHWLGNPRGVLAHIILTDQMARNMHRDTALAFATDRLAHAAADRAVAQGWDMRFDGPERQFFYTPFMHGETIRDQNRSVAMYATRLPMVDADHLLHARAHREVIRRFGRFPTRNAALGRQNSGAEADYLAGGGYGALVQALKG